MNTNPVSSSNKTVLAIFLLILGLFVVFIIFSFSLLSQLKSSSTHGSSSEKGKSASSKSVSLAKAFGGKSDSDSALALIKVEGEIMESGPVIELIHQALEEKEVKGVVVRVDSPGGMVGPTQEIYEELLRLDRVKPVYMSFGSLAASGGYYIGAAGRKIFALPGTLTGSIGVIMQFMDLSKLYSWAKVEPQVIKAGKYKDVGSSSRVMTEEERKLMNELVENARQQFMKHILAKRKKLTPEQLDQLAQGQIFSGEQALGHGLVDSLGTLWDCGRDLHQMLKLKGEFKEFREMKEHRDVSWFELLQQMEGSLSNLLQQTQSWMKAGTQGSSTSGLSALYLGPRS